MSELTTTAIVSIASTLTPLALHLGASCMNRVRNPKYIKKNVLVLPPKGGKSYLKSVIQSNDVLVVDLDEFMNSFNTSKDLDRLKECVNHGNLHEYDLFYQECSIKCLDRIKHMIKNAKKLRVLFVTSSYSFSSLFRKDAVCVASPNSDFFEKILKKEDAETRETLRKRRQFLLDSVPVKNAITTYNSYDELETMVRDRMGLKRHL
tara:strand:- start:1013 stop:1630 length:618 start_codon:yes stop_codon:yes gene_type:complete